MSPQASEEQRREWNGPDDATAINYLRERGYHLKANWTWRKPDDVEPSEKDISAIRFLIDEWDYGGLE